MAILKAKQIREIKSDDLNKKLSEFKLELLKEQGNVKMGRPIKNPGKIRVLKKSISRISTIQNERLKEVKK
jgi:large subunit ribosomal protein L29